MSISIKVSDNDEIPDYNIQAGLVWHVRRTTYDAVHLALGSYKTIESKADITIRKFTKSKRVSRDAKTLSDRLPIEVRLKAYNDADR